jgi:hypothetical protein
MRVPYNSQTRIADQTVTFLSAARLEDEPLRAIFDVGYFPPDTPLDN